MGLVAAGGSAFGSVWFVRAGLVALAVFAVVSVALAWRETRLAVAAGHLALMDQERRSREALRGERHENDIVTDLLRSHNRTLRDRIADVTAELALRQRQLAERQLEISRMRGDSMALRAERDLLSARVADLSAELSSLELRLDATDLDDAEVLSLPRRPLTQQRTLWGDDSSLWATGELPTVIELMMKDEADLAAGQFEQRSASSE